jgi:hypothetical protein
MIVNMFLPPGQARAGDAQGSCGPSGGMHESLILAILPRQAENPTPFYRTATIALRASRRSMATIRRSSVISPLYRPWIVRAARIRASPSAVLGPVLLPPCIRHREFLIAGDRHGLPLRVRAPQRGQDCAKDR